MPSAAERSGFDSRGSFLGQMCATLMERLGTLGDHCIICDKAHLFTGLLMPSVCHTDLCTFAYEKLGLMADVATMAAQLEVRHQTFLRHAI